MSREKNLAKNTIIIAFGTFLPKMTNLITLPLITAALTKEEYGTYDLISTLVALFLPFATLQIQSAAFRYLIDCRKNEAEIKRIITNIFAFVMPLSLGALAILFLSLHGMSCGSRILICSYFFADILLLTCQQMVRGLANNKLYSISAVVSSIMNLIFIIFFVQIEKFGLNGVIGSMTGATLIGLGILVIKGKLVGRIDFAYLSGKTIKDLLSYSWPMIPNSLSGWVLNFSDRIVLTIFVGLQGNALFAVASKIPSLFTTVQNTFVFAWQENASMASEDKDADKYFSDMFEKIYCILVGIMALLIAATPILFSILIRGDYKRSYYHIPILFLGVLFSALSSFLGGIYVAHKKTKNVGITTIMAAVLNLGIDLILVHIVGIFAASISTLVSYFALVLYRMIDILKFQNIKYNLRKMGLLLLFLCAMCVLCLINTLWSNLCNMIVSYRITCNNGNQRTLINP